MPKPSNLELIQKYVDRRDKANKRLQETIAFQESVSISMYPGMSSFAFKMLIKGTKQHRGDIENELTHCNRQIKKWTRLKEQEDHVQTQNEEQNTI